MAKPRTPRATREIQRKAILDFLLNGGKINPYSALQMFRCQRLASRIGEIKKVIHVDGKMIKGTNLVGDPCEYKEYWMVPAEQAQGQTASQ